MLKSSYSPLRKQRQNSGLVCLRVDKRLEFLFSLQIIANASFKFGRVLNESILDVFLIVELKTK